MKHGVEPIPTKFLNDSRELDPLALVREAFRQGWMSSRRWPNHPMPQHLFVSVEPEATITGDYVKLTIEWP